MGGYKGTRVERQESKRVGVQVVGWADGARAGGHPFTLLLLCPLTLASLYPLTLATRRAVCLLRSRRKTFLFERVFKIQIVYNLHK